MVQDRLAYQIFVKDIFWRLWSNFHMRSHEEWDEKNLEENWRRSLWELKDYLKSFKKEEV